MSAPVWTPSSQRIERSRMTAFLRHARKLGLVEGSEDISIAYAELWNWSVRERERFWKLMIDFSGLVYDGSTEPAGIGLERMAPPDPEHGPWWFPDVRLNFAENLLRWDDDRVAVVSWNEEGPQAEISYRELRLEVASLVGALKRAGVEAGDRVVGFLPNIPAAVSAMLATSAIGAIWSSCSPDFGAQGVLDRFGQIEPKVLFCADGYRYAGKEIDCLPRVQEVVARIESIRRVVIVPTRGGTPDVSRIRGAETWNDFVTNAAPREEAGDLFVRLPFNHPLYVMYSSGTTGLPKCMLHGAGGTLIQHCKELQLHTDVTREDRVFYFTTCGWMMWNWLVSCLAVGATIVLYDGAPMAPDADILWTMAEREKITVFGTSAKYLALCEKSGLELCRSHDLSALRTILSTGSPLANHSFDYVYGKVKNDVHLASISGGTDIISCFAGGNPVAAVFRGELQTRALGMAVDVWDEKGEPLRGESGELVCTKSFPSMPVAFWNDSDGSKYRDAYFDFFPGVWRHGDWCEITENNGMIIYGRSDATLNPGGVRIGTAELYRQVEQLPEVVESLAVGQEIGDQGDVRVVLFVRLRDGITLDAGLQDRIRRQIRENTSPLHVPSVIVQVADLPRTISGKISELAVRNVIHGKPVRNAEALANPAALELFRGLPELASHL